MKDFNVVSLSGGKDSTAMLFGMLERGIPIGDVVFFDTGWEFPEMHDHIKLVEEKSGLKVTVLAPQISFNHWLLDKKVIARRGENKGKSTRTGYGWPSPSRRWCTREKTLILKYYTRGLSCRKDVGRIVHNIGFAADEAERAQGLYLNKSPYGLRFPLIEWGWDEAKALAYCKSLGFHWGGLYDIFHRVSCFCCPLQKLENFRKLRLHRPDEWRWMLEQEKKMDTRHKIRIWGEYSVHDLDKRFLLEELDEI